MHIALLYCLYCISSCLAYMLLSFAAVCASATRRYEPRMLLCRSQTNINYDCLVIERTHIRNYKTTLTQKAAANIVTSIMT